MERVFNFGDDVQKVFPSSHSAATVRSTDIHIEDPTSPRLSRSNSLNLDPLRVTESGYSSVESLTSQDMDLPTPNKDLSRSATTTSDTSNSSGTRSYPYTSSNNNTSGHRSTFTPDTRSTPMYEREDEDDFREDESVCGESGVMLAGRNLVCIPTLTRDVSSVRLLDLSYNSLKTVRGIHIYEKLEELILDNNSLTQLLLPPMITLKSLSVNNNNLEDLNSTLHNIELAAPQLTYLSLLCNPLCLNELTAGDEDDYQMYRYTVISRLKNLNFLDSRPVTEKERADSIRNSSFNGIVRATDNHFQPDKTIYFFGSPLRESRVLKPNEKRTSVVGKLKKKYTGRHSEGNRFIRNENL